MEVHPDDIDLPAQFGPYELRRLIGAGGMARVYEARLTGVHGFVKRIAIKMMLPAYVDDEEFVTMLIDEAKIAAALNHSNICQIHDLGRIDDRYYIAMEYVEGADLNRVVNRSLQVRIPIPFDIIAHIGHEICAGLYYAHNKTNDQGEPLNIIHRDISPANILISNSGEVKIVDFGVAKAASRTQHTMVGVVKGKYQYMSPEQITGKTIDHRSDIFAAGIVLYESLAGQMMYPEGLDMLDRIRLAKMRPLKRIRPDVPPELNDIIKTALSRNPDDRYQSGAEMGEALEEFLVVYRAEHGTHRLDDLMTRLFDESRNAAAARGNKPRRRHRPPAQQVVDRPTKPLSPPKSAQPASDEGAADNDHFIIDDAPSPEMIAGRAGASRPTPSERPPQTPRGPGAATPARPSPSARDLWTTPAPGEPGAPPEPAPPPSPPSWEDLASTTEASPPPPSPGPADSASDSPSPPPSPQKETIPAKPMTQDQTSGTEGLEVEELSEGEEYNADEPTVAFNEMAMADILPLHRTGAGAEDDTSDQATATFPSNIGNPSISSSMTLPLSHGEDTIELEPEDSAIVEEDLAIEVDVDLSLMDTGRKAKEAFFLLQDPSGVTSGPFSRSQLFEMSRSGDLALGDKAKPVSELGVTGSSEDSPWSPAGLFITDLDSPFEESIAPSLKSSTRSFNIELESAARVFVELAMKERDGIVVFDRPGLHKKVVIHQGRPVFASSNLPGEQLGTRLVELNRLSREDRDRAIEQALREQQPLPQMLLRRGAVPPAALERSADALVRERLVQLFEWTAGHAAFYPGELAEHAPRRLQLDLLTLVSEGVRRWSGPDGPAGWLREHEDRTLILSGEPPTVLEALGLPQDQLAFLERFITPLSVREVIEAVVLERLDDEQIAFTVVLALNVGYLAVVAE